MPSRTASPRRRPEPRSGAPGPTPDQPRSIPRRAAAGDPHATGGAPAAADPPDRAAIDDIIADLLAKQSRLSAVLDAIDDPVEVLRAARLFALHGQNASRLGRLLRDARALSGKSADSLLDAIGTALDEINTQLGTSL